MKHQLLIDYQNDFVTLIPKLLAIISLGKGVSIETFSDVELYYLDEIYFM